MPGGAQQQLPQDERGKRRKQKQDQHAELQDKDVRNSHPKS